MDLEVICLLLLAVSVDSTKSNVNETYHSREPRVSGRIVKLYSGPRPEPVWCQREGFQADPVNCIVFYRCVRAASGKYTVFRYQCGPGTVYDPETEVCNHPQNTKRSECGGTASSSNEHNIQNEIDATQTELPSPIISMKPSYEHLFASTKYPWATTYPQKQETQKLSTAYPWATTGDNRKPLPPNRPTSPNGEPCTSDGFMGDSEDCRKFYRCVGNLRGGFIRYEYSCSDSTVWDEDAQTCNHPWAVQRRRCGRGASGDYLKLKEKSPHTQNPIKGGYLTENIPSQQQTQINYGSKVSQTQTQISNGPIVQNQTQINYGHRENEYNIGARQNQTQISHGSAISQTQTQINYGNKGSQTQLQVDHSQQSSQTQTQIYETSSKTTTTAQNDEDDQGYWPQPDKENEKPNETTENQNDCSESGFKGDKTDCRKFIRCVDNGRGGFIRYEFTCGEGTAWDSSIEGCNHISAVKECGGKAPEDTSHIDTTTLKSTQYTPASKPSTQGYPSTSSLTEEDDEDVGYGNQNQLTTAQSSSQTSVTGADFDRPTCGSSGFIGDKNDCKKFYRCVDNGKGGYTKYEFKCGEGTVWDSNIEACNHVWAVKHCGGSSSDINKEEASSTTKTTPITTVSLIQTTTETSSQNNDYDGGYGPSQSESTSTTTKPENQEHIQNDKCSSSGFMGDKNNCKKFYRCVDNGDGTYTRYEFSCGDGTVWDSKIEACNHAWAVENCGHEAEDVYKETTTTKPNPVLSDDDSNIIQTTETEKEHTTSSSTLNTSSSSTTSTPDENNQNQCHASGFMGDKNNCKKFYRCVDNGNGSYTRYEFSCGEGTVWDDSIEACNHDWAVKNCNGNNNLENSPETSSETSQTSPTSIAQESDTTSSTTSASTATKKPDTVDSDCKAEGFYGDPDNCKKFHRCVDNGKGSFTKYDFSCGDGTVWDQEIQACNHESSKGSCQNNGDSTSSSNTDYSSTTSSYTDINENNEETYPKPDSSPDEGNDKCTSEGFFGNSNNCKKFYRCVDNGKGSYTKYDFTCGEGTVWVQEIQACDHDDGTSNCSISETKPDETQRPTSTTTQSDYVTSSSRPDEQHDEYPSENDNEPEQGNDKCTSEGFYANKNDCTKFYRCVDNGQNGYTKYDFDCGEGTAWDQDLQTCNHISEVKSCDKSNQPEQSPANDDEQAQTTSSTSSSTTESSYTASQDTCTQEGYFGNKQDCKKFYRCVDNGKGGYTKYDYVCGEGTIWDQDLTTCNHPQDVTNPSCKESDSSSTGDSSSNNNNNDDSTTSASSGSSGSTESNNNQGSSDCNNESSSKKPNQNVKCEKAGYYANPNDCKKFYRCVDWDGDGKRFSVYHFDCGEGTIWDPALDTCNHEESVYPPRDCSGAQSENVDQESTTTEEASSTTDSNEYTTNEDTTTEYYKETDKTTEESQHTTEDQTTTQQSTTEQSTDSDWTTHEYTTEQTTNSEGTTHEYTTEETTHHEYTSEQTSDTDGTTEAYTTEQSTTHEYTTEESTDGTTQKSTTDYWPDSDGTSEHSTTESEDSISTTEQTDEYSTTESTTESSSTSNEECPDIENDQHLFVCPTSFRRHPKYCNLFYQCTIDDDTHDVSVAVFHCPNETIYDESQTKCVEESKANKKCDGEMAQKRRVKRFDTTRKEPIVVTKERLKCPAVGYFPFEKQECSSVFLKCEPAKSGKIRGFVYRCPDEHVYWSVSKKCEVKSKMKFCKRSYDNNWKGRWEFPVERINIARRK